MSGQLHLTPLGVHGNYVSLVGDRAGLMRLQAAIQEAIDGGEASECVTQDEEGEHCLRVELMAEEAHF